MSLTPYRTERERRQAHNEANAKWREATKLRPEPRVVDRVLVEALLVALGDPAIAPPEVRAAIMKATADYARIGLLRLDYPLSEIQVAVPKRIEEHLSPDAQSSVVHRALQSKAATGRIGRSRDRRSIPAG